MKQRTHRTGTITSLLRRALAEGGLTFKGIERETGLSRTSLMRFARGTQSLRLDIADRLATFFGFKVIAPKRAAPRRRKAKK